MQFEFGPVFRRLAQGGMESTIFFFEWLQLSNHLQERVRTLVAM